MYSVCYFCLILVKIGIYLQILVKIQNMELHEYLPRAVALYMGRRTASSHCLWSIPLTAVLLLQIRMKLLPIWSYVIQIMVHKGA